jgi:hypothetical protein
MRHVLSVIRVMAQNDGSMSACSAARLRVDLRVTPRECTILCTVHASRVCT